MNEPVAAKTDQDGIVYSARANSGPTAVLRDLRDGMALGPVWRAFAWDEIQGRYRRSALGLAWIVVSYLLYVGAIALFFGSFSVRGAGSFTNYVAVGYAAFTFLIANVNDGCYVFVASSTWIKSTSLPYSIYIYKGIARSLFPFVIQLIVAIGVMLVFGWRPTWSAIYAVPAVFAYLINAVWVQLLVGLIAARWRDFAHLVGSITRVLFFMTPILWVYGERAGLIQKIADVNPLTHFVEILRAPVLGEPTLPQSWPYVIGCTFAGWALAIAVAAIMRRRLPFWV